MPDLNRQLNEDGTVCCGDEKWRGRLCLYHQGLLDGAPEPLADDQHIRLREIASSLPVDSLTEADFDLMQEALSTLLDEVDQLQTINKQLQDQRDGLVSLSRQADAEIEQLREENTALGVRYQKEYDRANATLETLGLLRAGLGGNNV